MKQGWQEGVIDCPEFDLAITLESGQTFHWIRQEGKTYTGCIGRIPFFIRQSGHQLHYRGFVEKNPPDLPSLLSHYFALDHDLEAIRASCITHQVSHQASLDCKGLRIMRQPHWECIASFILSPMKQVAHIRQMSQALRNSYGENLQGTPVSAFPRPEILAACSEEELRRCGLGFRAKGLLGTAKLIATGEFDPHALSVMSTEKARYALCTLPGIGRKVANCILLFSYERLNAVPVDVWITRILGSFRSRNKATPEQLERYGERLLGPYAGYIQQYLFHQARTGKLTLPTRATKSKRSSRPTTLVVA